MKLIVVGSEGSIGKRRKGILEDMGHTVLGIDIKNNRYFDRLDLEEYDAVFICTPPVQSINDALHCANKQIPFFLEKPGAVNHRALLPVASKCEKSDLVNMVCCNIRFTTEYNAIKEALPNIGKPLFAYAEFGYFLPFWRDGQYRTYYSCYRAAGGGILMDSVHELDYMFSLFGYPDKVRAMLATYENTGELQELDAEDTVNLHIVYPQGLSTVIHLDYLQRAYKRVFFAIGTKGRIDTTFNVQGSNAMYKKEMQHFLDCVKKGTPTCKTVSDQVKLLEFIDKVHQGVKPNEKD